MKTLLSAAVACCVLITQAHWVQAQNIEPDDIFITSSSTKTPDEVTEAIKKYSEDKQWQFLGANKVKQGEITLVKICIPEVGRELWPVGPQIGAMLPCGNLSVYERDGMTEISLLDARYMHMLYPHPATEKASAIAQPLLMEMIGEVVK